MQLLFHEGLLEAQRQQQKLQESLYITIGLETKCQFDNAYEEAVRYVLSTEKLAVMNRSLLLTSGHPKAKETLNDILAEAIPVSMEFTPEGWFKMSFPAMLPHKKGGNTDYICGFLYPAMKRFRESGPPIYFGDCVFVLRHVYDYRKPMRLFRDHDNIEVNAVVDTLALYMLRSDGPMQLTHHYCSARGEVNCTEAYLVPQDDFIDFLVALKSGKIGAPEVQVIPS